MIKKMKIHAFYLILFTVIIGCSDSTLEQEKLKLEQEKLKLEREKLEKEKNGSNTDSKDENTSQGSKPEANSSVRNAKISGSSVYMRSDHSTTSKPVTLLNFNEAVNILDEYRPNGNYDEAILKSQTNFYDEYSGDFVFSLIKGKAVSVISNDGERCRISFVNDKNKTGYASLSVSQLEFISGDMWYYVSNSSGKKGWVLGKYIQE
jgi:hypothetical protein